MLHDGVLVIDAFLLYWTGILQWQMEKVPGDTQLAYR